MGAKSRIVGIVLSLAVLLPLPASAWAPDAGTGASRPDGPRDVEPAPVSTPVRTTPHADWVDSQNGWAVTVTVSRGHAREPGRTTSEVITAGSATASGGVPAVVLQAYRDAASDLARLDPGCHLDWTLLAAIGQVESNHGRYGGAVVGADGLTSPRILGLPLNGVGPVAAIRDTDGGAYDGDTVWDRAVGPMQFIPSTWAAVASDGDGNGVSDPNDIHDAALGAAVYLCAGDADLSDPADLRAAVLRYNHSDAYADLVLALMERYRTGTTPTLPVGPTASGPDVPGTSVGGALGGRENSGRENGPQDEPGPSDRPAPRDEPGRLHGRETPRDDRPAEPDPSESPTPPAEPSEPSTPQPDEQPGTTPTEGEPPTDEQPGTAPTEGEPPTDEQPAATPTEDEPPTDEQPAATPTEDEPPTDEQPGTAPTEDEPPTDEQPAATPIEGEQPTDEETGSTPDEGPAEPVRETLTGELARVAGGGWTVGGSAVHVADTSRSAPADLDGDGTVETLGNELAGLESTEVTVTGTVDHEVLRVEAVGEHALDQP
ncbi:lytic murein transglycosylase [Georgenia alba]|uniref:Lytic murein transglycosylase n=1 Tax=Georgenia alba TaxID=2233858 RepID=A0ABW2Q968_9MICO